MQTHLWNPWFIFDELERSMSAAGSSAWPQFANGELTIQLTKAAKAKPRRIKLTSGGVAAKLKGLLGGDHDKKQAA